jgi:dihydropteroate synthase
MVGIIAQAGAGAVIMHMRGDPKTMQDDPRYEDVVRQVRDFLEERVRSASANGVAREAVAVDPGIGFGKSVAHNLTLLRGLGTIAAIGVPIVVGVSRKSFIGALGGCEAGERLPGSLAAATLAVAHGAHVVRAHDVAETVRAMRVADAVLRGRENL